VLEVAVGTAVIYCVMSHGVTDSQTLSAVREAGVDSYSRGKEQLETLVQVLSEVGVAATVSYWL
jgi:hypothetical protein